MAFDYIAQLNSLDASVFNGELLSQHLKEFREYILRWQRAVEKYETCGGTMEENVEKLSDHNPWAGIRCIIHEYSSRVCERGTKGCVVEHTVIDHARAEQSLRRRRRAPEVKK